MTRWLDGCVVATGQCEALLGVTNEGVLALASRECHAPILGGSERRAILALDGDHRRACRQTAAIRPMTDRRIDRSAFAGVLDAEKQGPAVWCEFTTADFGAHRCTGDLLKMTAIGSVRGHDIAAVIRDEIAVRIGICKDRAGGGGADVGDAEGIGGGSVVGGVGGAGAGGVTEEQRVAVGVANEEIEIAVGIGIGKARAGV